MFSWHGERDLQGLKLNTYQCKGSPWAGCIVWMIEEHQDEELDRTQIIEMTWCDWLVYKYEKLRSYNMDVMALLGSWQIDI